MAGEDKAGEDKAGEDKAGRWNEGQKSGLIFCASAAILPANNAYQGSASSVGCACLGVAPHSMDGAPYEVLYAEALPANPPAERGQSNLPTLGRDKLQRSPCKPRPQLHNNLTLRFLLALLC